MRHPLISEMKFISVPEPKVNPKIIKMKAENRNPISILNEMYPMNIGPVPVYECSAVNTGKDYSINWMSDLSRA